MFGSGRARYEGKYTDIIGRPAVVGEDGRPRILDTAGVHEVDPEMFAGA